MKKIFLAVAAMAMLATACTKDDSAVVGNDSLVSFTIDSPELQTRYGEGNEAKVLNYAFYNEEGILEAISATTAEKAVTLNADRKATIQVPLVEGRTYSAIFWASASDAIADGVYTVDWTAKTVEMATNLTANDEDYDAFYNYTINIDPAKKTHKIELRRPFAQINIATADKTAAASAGFDAAATKVTVNAYKKLQFAVKEIEGVNTPVAEVAGDMVPFTYGWAANATGTATVGSKTYDMLSMNYVLVDARTLVNVKMEVSEDDTNFTAPITREYTTVPVQRNYRTYIVGNLLTTTNEFNVTTVPGFNPNDEVYYVWDGSELTKPAYDATTKTYTVTKASDLAWIGALVNGTLPSTMRSTEYAPAESIDGCTIVLGDDLDFGGNEFTPISKAYNITFDGNGKAIRNISYANGVSYSTMFETVSGTFKNFTMENVKAAAVDNGRAAALLGYYMSGTVEEVHVKNVEIKGFQKLAGLVANVVASDGSGITIKDCSVEDIKISANEKGAVWQAGGIVGYIVTGVSASSTTEVVFENCEVKGQIEINDTPAINEYNDTYYSFYSGGFVGSIGASTTAAKVAPVYFNNCKVGTVTATPALSVSDRGTELWGSCSANLAGRPNNVIYVDGVQYVYKTASQKAFEAAIAEGGEVKLTEDVEIVAPVVIAEGAEVTIDLNGKTISGGVHKSVGPVLKNNGTLTINGGTIASTANNGGSAIANYGTLTVEGATINGAQREGESWPAYPINNYGSMTLTNAVVVGYQGCVALNAAGTTVLNNCELTKNYEKTSSHVFYVNHADAKVVVNGGTYNHNGFDGSLAYVNKGEVTINGGTFNAKDGGYGFAALSAGKVTINGGNINAGLLNWGGSIVVNGGTFKTKPADNYIAEGYKAVATNGKYMVVADTVSEDAIVSDAAGLANAIVNGGEAILTGDVEWNAAINNDANINLNGNTFEATYSYTLKDNADLTMVGGNYEVNGTYGHVDVRPSTTEGSVVVFEDVDFSYNKLGPSYGPSTNRLGSVVEVCANVTDAHTKILFKNCTFDNAQVLFEGMSGKTGTFEAEFDGCTFNALTSSAPIAVDNYVEGTIKMTDCTFNLTCTSSTASAVSVSSSSSTSVTVTATNNTINAVAATPYTFDASKGETEVHNVKVNGTPANIKFISYYANTTVNETGTTKTGIAQ
ncbi:MAG: hypothetical protein IKM03_07365 [Alistipes sp.]|nr:hypothetical protein [Alistipes sp.]